MPKQLLALVLVSLASACVDAPTPPSTGQTSQDLLAPSCGGDPDDPFYDPFDNVGGDDPWCDPGDGGGGGDDGGGSTGCSQSMINQLIASCHQQCNTYGASSCSRPGVVQYCAHNNGILYCNIEGGALDAPCADEYASCH